MVKLLNASQVAKKLNVRMETVKRWTRAGKIDYIQLPSGRYKYHESKINEIIGGKKYTVGLPKNMVESLKKVTEEKNIEKTVTRILQEHIKQEKQKRKKYRRGGK